jgi:hypothetical protein
LIIQPRRQMNKLFKTISILATILSATLMFAPFVFAQPACTATIQFENTPLFSSVNFLPGDDVARWIKITNNCNELGNVSIQALGFPNPIPSDDLSHALNIEIKNGASILYGPKTLLEFYQAGIVNLGAITNGQTNQYDITISFPEAMESQWQGKTTGFNLQVSARGESETSEIKPTVLTDIVGGGGDGGGSGPANLYIFNEQITTTTIDSATISWQTNYPADSRVVYSSFGQTHTFDWLNNPNFGYINSSLQNPALVSSHSMVISGLLPATTYYFRCISQNGTGPAVSGELSFVTLGVEGAFTENTGGSSENQGGTGNGTQGGTEINGGLPGKGDGFVAGASTGGEGPATETQSLVDGAKNLLASVGASVNGFCWIILIVIIALLLWYLWLVIKRKEGSKVNWILPLIILALLAFYFIKCRPSCGLTCGHRFWLLLAADIILFLASLFLKKK